MSDFWITNISKMNVCLRDLNLTVKARSSINLMDLKHYRYTLEQLQKSAESGSLYRNSDKIKVCNVAPTFRSKRIQLSKEPLARVNNPLFSTATVVEEKFEELLDNDIEMASDIADIIAGIDDDDE